MEYVTLGGTGLRISRLGFGGIPIQRVDAPAAKELLEAVRTAGINYIDTARGYTVSEELIGQAIEENNEKLSQDISRMVNDKVLKEIDYLMRVADERDEERFRQLDETIRLYQKENKGRAEAAAAKAPFLPSIFRKRKFGRNGNKL